MAEPILRLYKRIVIVRSLHQDATKLFKIIGCIAHERIYVRSNCFIVFRDYRRLAWICRPYRGQTGRFCEDLSGNFIVWRRDTFGPTGSDLFPNYKKANSTVTLTRQKIETIVKAYRPFLRTARWNYRLLVTTCA